MSLYESRAFGIELDSRMANVDLTKVKCHFIVSPGGSGGTLNPMIGQNIDRANNLGVPFFMTWQVDPNPYLGIAQNSYPQPEDDTHIKMMDRAVYIGGTPAGIKRKIHGIILDIRNNTTYNNQQVTQVNFRNMALYLFNTVWSRYRIPVYIEASQALLNSYTTGCEELSLFLSTCDGICSWKSAQPGASTTTASWSNFPIPSDSYKVEYVGNAPIVYLSKYASTVFNFPGITDSSGSAITVGLWMYKSSPSILYSDINYSGTPISLNTTISTNYSSSTDTSGSSTDTSGSSTDTSGSSTDTSGSSTVNNQTLTEIYTLLQSMQTTINTINTNVETIKTHFT